MFDVGRQVFDVGTQRSIVYSSCMFEVGRHSVCTVRGFEVGVQGFVVHSVQ